MSTESIFASPRYCSVDEAKYTQVSVDDLKNGKYVFEYVRTKTTRFYADFDLKHPMTSEEFSFLRYHANQMFKELSRKGYVYTDGSYEDGDKRKVSFHLINKNIQIYKNAFSWKTDYGQIMLDEILGGFLKKSDVEGKTIYPRLLFKKALDDAVYGMKTCFRLPYATYKAAEPEDDKPYPHIPMIDTGDISDYFITITSGVRHPMMDILIKEHRVKEDMEKLKKQDLEMKQAQNPVDTELDAPITEERQKQILEKLNVVKKDRFKEGNSFDGEWAKLGRLIKSNNLDKSIFLQISKESGYANYKEDDCLEWWFSEKSKGKVGFPTLNKWLEEDGIDLKMFCQKTKTIVGKMLSKINETGTLTHAHIAEIFFEEKKEDIYNTQMGWLVFDEVKGWVLGDDQLILLPFIKTCGMALNNYVSSMKSASADGKFTVEEQKKKDLLRKVSNKILDYSYISKAIKVMTMMFHNQDVIKEFDCHPELFAFSDLKAWDLVQGKAIELTKHHKIFTTCGYPMPERVEEEVQAAKDFILTYQEESALESFLSMCACSLYGKNKNQVIFIHTGVGGNGKSVHADLMMKTLGNYAGLIPIEQFTVEAKSRSEANSSLAALVGKRYARSNEPEDDAGQKLKISRIKQITGDEEVDVRKLYGETFQMVIRFMVHILANDIPSLSKQDGGIARRIKVVRYPFTFKDEPDANDNTQKQKILEINLDQYKHGFFFLCADAWRKTNGVYQETAEVKEDVDEYLRENNPLIPFLSTFEYSEKPIRSKELHELFNNWCDKAKIERYKNKAFSTILESAILPNGDKVRIEKDPKNGNKIFIKQIPLQPSPQPLSKPFPNQD